MHISDRAKARLVRSADDYGIRDTVRYILPLAKAGKLDRVAVMVRYCTPADAAALLETDVKIDIHLDLIELMGRGTESGRSTVRRGLHFVARHVLGSFPAVIVEAEWRSQIDLFHELFGRYPDGLNSHEHIHFFPHFFRIIVLLANEFRVPYLRFGGRGMLLSFHHSAIGHILHQLARIDHHRFLRANLSTSTYLVSLDWVRGKERFFHALEALSEEESVELVVHPEREWEFNFIQHHL